jgi:16S rRNA (guanine966-N2)-methyltransferase
MSINILGGVAKGLKLSTPNNLIRPTSVLLRRRFFDAKQDLVGFEFVDLCAGSGAMGIEAVSRGADLALFNEYNPRVYKTLLENLKILKEKIGAEKCKASKSKFQKFLEHYEVKNNSILFFDPPYEEVEFYHQFAQFMHNHPNGIYIIEFCRQKTMTEDEMCKLMGEPERSYQQGTSFLYVYDFQ